MLGDAASQYRDLLTRCGVGPGDLVISATGNRLGLVPLVVAAWQLGAPLLPVDASAPPEEIADLVTRFAARALVLPTGAFPGALPNPVCHADGLSFIPGAPAHASSPSAYRDVALLKLTSGSTGLPKAVVTEEAQLLADTDHIVTAMGITAGDVQLAVIPLSHAYGFGNLIMPLLLQGSGMVIRESFAPLQLLADARRFETRVFHGVPFMYQHYVTHPPPEAWPPSLTLLVSAGARLERATVRAFHARFGVKIHSFYGASESGGITFDGDERLDELATVGRPLPGVTIELRPDPDVPADYGRVYVRGTAVSPSYVGDTSPEDTLRDGGFLTGDYGHFAADGRLVLVGRVSTFINVAGRKVQPGEVERVLREMEGVTEARVLPAMDVSRGEQIAAVVAGDPESGLTLAAVRAHCASRLPPHKIPRIVVVVREMPVTSRGKTDYRALHSLIQAQAVSRA